jgi:sodium/potassium/calcium exchanger 6
MPSNTNYDRRVTAVWNDFFNSISIRQVRRKIRKHLFPTLVGFRQKSIFSKISSVFSAPVVFLLSVTLPVIREADLNNKGIQLNDDTDLLQDYDDDELEARLNINAEQSSWVKWLTAVQFICAPLLISFVLISQQVGPVAIVLPVTLAVGVLITIAFWLTTSTSKQPRLFWMMCFMGFAVAVLWIFLIANEVVSVLQAIGMALGVSEAILGLTVFALVSLYYTYKFEFNMSYVG